MKAICINEKWVGHLETQLPQFGEEVEIIDTKEEGELFPHGLPGIYYALGGRLDPEIWFHSKNFSNISNRDEAEMIRNYQTQTA